MGLTEWISSRGSLIGIIIGYSQCLGSLFSPCFPRWMVGLRA